MADFQENTLKNFLLISLNKLKIREKDPFLFISLNLLMQKLSGSLRWLFDFIFTIFLLGGERKSLDIYRTKKKKKKTSYLYFPVSRRPECFLLVSKQILLLGDFSRSVIKSFMLKQYENIQSVMLCHPLLFSLCFKFSLEHCCGNEIFWLVLLLLVVVWGQWVCWGVITAAPQCCPCCVGDTSGLVFTLTFCMVCGCKYQSSYASCPSKV